MRVVTLVLLIVLVKFSLAQVYPYKEGFETTLSGQIPAGYSGDVTVLTYHGLNDGKALAALLFSGDTEDSITSPLIGPLNSNSILVFYYRWVRDNIYPSQPKMPVKGDKMEVQLTTDSLNFTTIHLIDSSNHQPNLNFKRVQLNLGAYAGEQIRIKFRCIRGSDRYFMDIDSISVQNQGGKVGFDEVIMPDMSVFPNPAKDYFHIKLSGFTDQSIIRLYSISGGLVWSGTVYTDDLIDVRILMNGIYFVELETTDGILRKKIIVQH